MESTALVPSTPSSTPLPTTVERYPSPEERLDRRADTERLGERIAELAAQISAATYQLLLLIHEFDQRDGWACGFRSCAHWLSWRTGVAMGAAREKVRVARALAELPTISRAMRSAEISYSKVRALTRVASPDSEERLLEFAMHATASQVERFVRAWRQVDRGVEAEAVRERETKRHESRYLEIYTDDSGMVVVHGRLEPEAGAVLRRALDAAGEVLYGKQRLGQRPATDAPTSTQRRADAAGLLAEAALASGLGDEASLDTRADRFQVVVHVDTEALEDPEAPGLSEIEDTGDVPAETSRRLACDSSTVTMTQDSRGRVLDVGRKTRVISAALRRALKHRDNTCRFPGCDLTFCDAHHVHHWGAGGETKLDNLVLLCRRHHRCVHEEGFRVEETGDGGFRFLSPDGRATPEAPPLPATGQKPVSRLLRQLIEAGLDVESLDHYPKWDGSSLDLPMAIDGLWSPSADGA